MLKHDTCYAAAMRGMMAKPKSRSCCAAPLGLGTMPGTSPRAAWPWRNRLLLWLDGPLPSIPERLPDWLRSWPGRQHALSLHNCTPCTSVASLGYQVAQARKLCSGTELQQSHSSSSSVQIKCAPVQCACLFESARYSGCPILNWRAGQWRAASAFRATLFDHHSSQACLVKTCLSEPGDALLPARRSCLQHKRTRQVQSRKLSSSSVQIGRLVDSSCMKLQYTVPRWCQMADLGRLHS